MTTDHQPTVEPDRQAPSPPPVHERPAVPADYTPPPGYMLVPAGYTLLQTQQPQAPPRHTTGQAHGGLWCAILGWIIPIVGWFMLGPIGFSYGITEFRRAKREGRPVGVPIAAIVIGAVPAAVTAAIVLYICVSLTVSIFAG